MPYPEFFSVYFLDYLIEVAFALGLVVVGLHLAERARELFGVRRYRSALVFCHVGTHGNRQSKGESGSQTRDVVNPFGEISWKTAHGVDEQFAQWVREPGRARRFTGVVYWADVLSESPSADGPRFVIGLQQSQSLDGAMRRILSIPFHVAFRSVEEDVVPADATADEL